MLTLFERGLKKGFGEDGQLLDGSQMKIDQVGAFPPPSAPAPRPRPRPARPQARGLWSP